MHAALFVDGKQAQRIMAVLGMECIKVERVGQSRALDPPVLIEAFLQHRQRDVVAEQAGHPDGGGVIAAGELLLGPARDTFRRHLTGRGYRPEARIVAAALGNEAGLIGAADLARRDALGRAGAGGA